MSQPCHTFWVNDVIESLCSMASPKSVVVFNYIYIYTLYRQVQCRQNGNGSDYECLCSFVCLFISKCAEDWQMGWYTDWTHYIPGTSKKSDRICFKTYLQLLKSMDAWIISNFNPAGGCIRWLIFRISFRCFPYWPRPMRGHAWGQAISSPNVIMPASNSKI